MQDKSINGVICINCKKHFLHLEKVGNESYIAICECDKYPLVKGILYLRNGFTQKKVLTSLEKGNEFEALLTLLNIRILLLIPVLTLTFIDKVSSVFKRKILFKVFVIAMKYLSYSKDWSWYLINRKRIPSYFISLLSLNLINEKGCKILDIGCGPGYFLSDIYKKTKPRNVIGIDASFLNLYLARLFFANPKTLFVCFDVNEGLPFIKNNFDFVHLNDTFHYIDQKDFFLKEVSRVVKKVGKLAIIQTLNTKRLGNIKGLSPDSFKHKLQSAGFKKISLYSNESLWCFLNWTVKIRLTRSDHKRYLSHCTSYSVFASKTKLSKATRLNRKAVDQLKLTKVDYRNDKRIFNEFRRRSLFRKYSTFIFLSPHFDDAVYSCGSMLASLQEQKKKVKVITFFTKISSPPFTPQAEDFLQKSTYKNADRLFEDRKKEDIKAVQFFEGNFIHLDYVEAAWRKKNGNHVYKDDKSQFSGEIGDKDKDLIGQISKKIYSLVSKGKKTLVLAPLGIGGHADHVMIREAVQRLSIPTLFWEDFPYNTSEYSIKQFFSQNANFNYSFSLDKKDFSKKQRAIKLYKSQVEMHFPNGVINKVPEKYYTLYNTSHYKFKEGRIYENPQ